MLPTPNLDDRRFQDLVDDAKRMVQRRCPEWTDHNVSDPGVTLIETVAFMADELFYRLNRVPDRLYVAFLDLLGVTLHPAGAATVDVTMWLSAPQPETVVVPEGTESATQRAEGEEPVVFATTAELRIPPRSLTHVLTQRPGGEPVPHDEQLSFREPFPVFADVPQLDDVLLLGLDDAAPSCVVVLRFDSDVQGVGVDPRHPPIVWEAWDGRAWVSCDVDSDGTGGLNRPGDVVLHVPPTHTAHVLADRRAGWLRCRVVPPDTDYTGYSASPTVREASAFTIGGTVAAVHAATVEDEVVGLSEGTYAQVFPLEHGPVVAGPPLTLEVAAGPGWDTWTEVTSFAGHGPDDQVFLVDRAAGALHLAPAVREADGTLRAYGAVPPKGAPMRLPRYRTGGGPDGNVAPGTIQVLRGAVPFVDRVSNRRAAVGGVAAETVDEAKERGPLALRVRDRAVTTEDYEEIARDATTGVARVRAVAAGDGADAGAVRVLVVPTAVPDAAGMLRFEDLVPPAETLAAIADHLDDRRPVGARVLVEPPFYQGVTVVARLSPRPRADVALLATEAERALYRYFDPLTGGPDGDGWPFGRPVQAGEVYAVLQRLSGTELVEDVKLFAADPITGRRGEAVQRIDLDKHALVFSFRHQVRVAKH
ncbi:putative baseplate assembly protein [Cellulomonas fimi]|uniref:putative baseplate assembly protein n=1 Tax=Cellulomonas fimi TaxID=1708 RepID=UPI0023599CE0|nr:putative baseplate assembly protein [Cellulomonas fimi]